MAPVPPQPFAISSTVIAKARVSWPHPPHFSDTLTDNNPNFPNFFT